MDATTNAPRPSGVRPTLVIALLAAVALAAGIYYFAASLAREDAPAPGRPAAQPDVSHPAAAVREPSARQAILPRNNPPALPALISKGSAPADQLSSSSKVEVGQWEQHLDEVLGSDAGEEQKLTALLALFPRVPLEAQPEVAQHISNLLPDEQYSWLDEFLTNATMPEPVLDVFMSDVLNRGDDVKLPALLQVARTDGHPKAAEAREVLEFYVEADYGTNWPKWESAIHGWLKETGTEPSAQADPN